MLRVVSTVLLYAAGAPGGSMHFKDDNYKLDYKMIRNHKVIESILEVKTLGWLGLGLWPGSEPNMIGADYFLASVVDGEFVGGDYHIPILTFFGTSFKEKNGKTFVTVKRLLDTGDSKHDHPIYNSPMCMLWVYSLNNSDPFAYHGSNMGSQFVNFFGPKMGASSSSMQKASPKSKGREHKKYKESEEYGSSYF